MLRVEARRSRRVGRRLVLLATLLSALIAPSVASANWSVQYQIFGYGSLSLGPTTVCASSSWTAQGAPGAVCNAVFPDTAIGIMATAHPGSASTLPGSGWAVDFWGGNGVVQPGGMTYFVPRLPLLPVKTIAVHFKDLYAPVVTLVSGPFGVVGSNTATFWYKANENVKAFYCSMDGGPYMLCGTNVAAGLAASKTYFLFDGVHTFRLYAVDPSNHVSLITARTWTISHVGPLTTLTGVPASPSNVAQPAFTFVTAPGASSFCSLDNAPSVPCVSPYTVPSPLADGSHTFAVISRIGLGNFGPAATHQWVVDRTAPVISIAGIPAEGASTDQTSVQYILDTSEPLNAAGFSCSLDGATAVPCTSPVTYNGLALGQHKLVVYGTDLAGNVGSAARTWTIVAPAVTPVSPAVIPTVPAVTPTTSAPSLVPSITLTKVTISVKSFRAAKSGAMIVSATKKVGAKVTFRLSKESVVRVTIYKANGVKLGSVRYAGKAGLNAFRITGRIAGKRLAPGSYRLVLKLGNGVTKTVAFRIIR